MLIRAWKSVTTRNTRPQFKGNTVHNETHNYESVPHNTNPTDMGNITNSVRLFASINFSKSLQYLEVMVQDLRGSLQEGALANLLQYLALNQVSGCLNVDGPKNTVGKVYLTNGRVVHATSSTGGWAMNAVAEMVGWTEGTFRFKNGELSPELTLDLTLERLLLDASLMLDETRRSGIESGIQPRPPMTASTMLKLQSLDQMKGSVELPVFAAGLLAALDGKRSLEKVAAQINTPLEKVLEIAAQVVGLGLAVPVTGPRVPQDFVTELTARVVRILGPVGEIIVEDAFEDLGLNPSDVPFDAIPGLLQTINEQFRNDQQRAQFSAASREVRAKYKV